MSVKEKKQPGTKVFLVMDWIVLPVLLTFNVSHVVFRWWYNYPAAITDTIPWILVFVFWGTIKYQRRVISTSMKMFDDLGADLKEQFRIFLEKNKDELNK